MHQILEQSLIDRISLLCHIHGIPLESPPYRCYFEGEISLCLPLSVEGLIIFWFHEKYRSLASELKPIAIAHQMIAVSPAGFEWMPPLEIGELAKNQ